MTNNSCNLSPIVITDDDDEEEEEEEVEMEEEGEVDEEEEEESESLELTPRVESTRVESSSQDIPIDSLPLIERR
jgi:hypothetical protein